MGLNNASIDNNMFRRMPPEAYLPLCKKAADVIGGNADDSNLFLALFNDEELAWLKKQYQKQPTSH